MKFLGSLDDKTLQYPFGKRDQIDLSLQRTLLGHLLSDNETLLVEEGFLLASPEAVDPENTPPFLLHAIKHGHIKVTSRTGNLLSYRKKRAEVNHAVPPENSSGDFYLKCLQKACEDSDAFIPYPHESIDEITYKRFLSYKENDFIQSHLNEIGFELTKDFYSLFEQQYRTGSPKGGQWTARAAWEEAARLYTADNLHTLMVLANRDRQILRSVAIASEQGRNIKVETGVTPGAYDLAAPQIMSLENRRDDNRVPPSLRIPLRDISKQPERLLKALGEESSVIATLKRNYITQMDRFYQEGDQEALQAASKYYEDELYRLANAEKIEDRSATGIAVTVGVAIMADCVVSSIDEKLYGDRILTAEEARKRELFTRRRFLKTACAVFAGASFAASDLAIDSVKYVDEQVGIDSENLPIYLFNRPQFQTLTITEENIKNFRELS